MYVTIADELRAEGRAEGRAAGKAEAVLGVLRFRALAVSVSLRARVLAMRDEAQLERCFERAFTVTSADALLDEPEG